MGKQILKVGKYVATGGLLGVAGKALFGKKKKSTPTPEVTPPTMPLPDDEAVARARKEAIIRQRGRGGRSSTILTDGETLGGY